MANGAAHGNVPLEARFFSENLIPDYNDLVLALMGSKATVNAVEMAAGREAAKFARRYAPSATGRMKSSIRARARTQGGRIRHQGRWVDSGQPKVKHGTRITVNRAGDYSPDAGRRGGVRYGTVVHQGVQTGRRVTAPRPFLYEAIDRGEPRAAMEAAMSKQWGTVRDRLVVRARVLEGVYGREAQQQLQAKLTRAGTAISPGRQTGAAGRIARAQVRNKSAIARLATAAVRDGEEAALRGLKLGSLTGGEL